MDINITNPVSTAAQFYKPPTPTGNTDQTPAPAPAQQPVQQVQTDSSANNNASLTPAAIQAQYEEAVRQAALSFKNSYPLGDQEFSIFKDATGQYITRYVSLRDGSITYVPQPVLVRQAVNAISPAQISFNA